MATKIRWLISESETVLNEIAKVVYDLSSEQANRFRSLLKALRNEYIKGEVY